MAKIPGPEDFGARPTPSLGRVGPYTTGAEGVREQAAANLGRAAQVFGREVSEAVERQKKYDDTLRAESAFNRLRERQIDLTIGDDGFTRKKGEQATGEEVFQKYETRFNTEVQQIANSLENDEQRAAFRQRADISRLQFKEDQIRHFTSEREKYAKEVYGNTLILEQNQAAQRWEDPNAIKMSVSRIKGVIANEADRNGWSDEKRKAAQMEAEAQTHVGVINQALASDRPEYAKEWYQQHKNLFDATTKAKMQKIISMGEQKVLAQTVADEYLGSDISESEAISEVRKNYSGDEEAAIVDHLKMRYNERSQANEAEQRNAGDTAWRLYADTSDLSSIPVTIQDKMDGKELEALRRYARDKAAGKTVTTDMGVYQELIFEASENPNKFVQRNILASADKLSESDRRKFIEWQAKIRSGETTPDLVVAATRDQIIKQAVAGMGYDPTKATKKDNEEVRDAYRRINNEILAYQHATGKEPDDAKVQEIADRLTLKVIRERRFVWDVATPAGRIEIEGVPTELIDEYAMAVKNAGQPVTERNIKLLHNYLTQQKAQPTVQQPSEPVVPREPETTPSDLGSGSPEYHPGTNVPIDVPME